MPVMADASPRFRVRSMTAYGPGRVTRPGPSTDLPTAQSNVRFRSKTGKIMLAVSISSFDPERRFRAGPICEPKAVIRYS
jgi:hypothetical protein